MELTGPESLTGELATAAVDCKIMHPNFPITLSSKAQNVLLYLCLVAVLTAAMWLEAQLMEPSTSGTS